MSPPAVTIYITSLTSQPRVRQHTELLHRSLRGLEIPYESFDLAADTEAKTRWQRAKPPGMVIGLPGYLVGGQWIGTMDDFEQAVEDGTLPTFLKQDIQTATVTDPVSGRGSTNEEVQEAELEKLMRGMTDQDLDKLVDELGGDDLKGGTKVGLIVPDGVDGLDTGTIGGSGGKDTALEQTGAGDGDDQVKEEVGDDGEPPESQSLIRKARLSMEMMTADSIDGLLGALGKAEGKVEVGDDNRAKEKEKEKVE